MTWSDVTRPPKPKVIRQFGLLCLIILGAAGCWQAFRRGHTSLGLTLAAIGLGCGVLGWFAPRLFRWVYTGAMVVVFPIGFVVSQIMLLLLYFLVFLPIGVLLRLSGWDAMIRKRKSGAEGYWEAKTTPADVRRYLRQY